MMEQVRVGILGTSWWADAMYLPALKNHPKASIEAVAGRNPETTRAFASRWEIRKNYENAEELIEQAEIDALIVATGNDSHCPLTLKALERGLHLLCEKPLGLNFPEAAKMAAKAKEQGVVSMVPFTYSFMPATRYLRELIMDGYLGQPYHLNMRYYGGGGRKPGYLWRFDTRRGGTGALGDIGSHFLYIARLLFGEIVQVRAQLDRLINRPNLDPDGMEYPKADDTALICLKFENGAQGVVHASTLAYEPTTFSQIHQMEFHGSDGTLHSYNDWDQTQQISGTRVGEGSVSVLEIPERIWGQVRRDKVHDTYRDVFRKEGWMTGQFIDAIAEGKSAFPDFLEGAFIQRILDAALLSDLEHRSVSPMEILS